MTRQTLITAIAATCTLAMGVPAPGEAAARKPKLYSVSLGGDARNEVTVVREDAVPPPMGCVGEMSETHRLVASAGLAPRGGAAPVASCGRLKFRAHLTSPSARSTTATSGSFAPDPNFPPDDPAVCAVAPETESNSCELSPAATRKPGAEFVLLPDKGRYELYYNRSPSIVSCEDDLGESLVDVAYPKLTKLRVSAVRRLARGTSVSVSGTAVTPPRDPGATGGETLRYTLEVKRVR